MDNSILPIERTLIDTTSPGQSRLESYRNEGVLHKPIAQSAGAVEYTNCFSAEGQDPPNEYPGYNSKQSDGEVPVMLKLWGIRSTPSLPSLPGPL